MRQMQSIPLFLNEGAGADRGLICGYSLQSHGPAREVTADGIVEALAQTDQVTWLHFNLSDQRARRWLLDAAFVPPALREVLQEHDENRRVEWTDGGLLMVISDFTYDCLPTRAAADPRERRLHARSFVLAALVVNGYSRDEL
jgi:zinc transporter